MANTLTWVEMGDDSSINVLPDDVLLEIFDFCRMYSALAWNHEGWYKLAHTCRRWRSIIFASPSRLDLQLYCTYGTPVADMLSYSPPLPLSTGYPGRIPLRPKDEEGVLLVLQKRDRVRSLCLSTSAASLSKLFAVMSGTFPVLEDLSLSVLEDPDEEESEDDEPDCPQLPQAFQAPNLHCLELSRVGCIADKGLPLLASLSDLVSIALTGIPDPIYLPLASLVSRFPFIPQLEHLEIAFSISSSDINLNVWEEATDILDVKPVSLPSLSSIEFQGASAYLEGLVSRIDAPFLTNFRATFFETPSSTLPHISRLLCSAIELWFPVASIKFSGVGLDNSDVAIYLATSEESLDQWTYRARAPFAIVFPCPQLNIQVTSAGRICAALTPVLLGVEKLHLDLVGRHWRFRPDGDIEAERWHDLLRPFSNIKKLQVDAGLMKDLSAALCANNNGTSMEILPTLCKITRPDYTRFRGAFDEFIAARRRAGQHITKRRRPRNPYDFRRHEDEEDDQDSDGEDDEDEDEQDEEEDEDESDGEDDEDEDEHGEEEDEGEREEEERWEEGSIELGTEAERQGRDRDPNTDVEPDPDSRTSDDSGSSTELDSDDSDDSLFMFYCLSRFRATYYPERATCPM